jgi:phenylacetate-CoA ligase
VQPLIRYELTDRMTQVDSGAADGHPRVMVAGRSDDLLRYGGVIVHPHAIRSVLVHTPAVREYQVKQTERGVDLDVVTYGAELDVADLVARTEKALATAGLPSPRAGVRVVDALPRDERSGKVRRIVPRK